MGFALAEEAARRGADVTLVAGPVNLPTPPGVRRIDVVSAAEMLAACAQAFPRADIFIAAAAVGDYAPVAPTRQKIKKTGQALRLELKPASDILKTLAEKKKKGQIVVGFAAETENLREHALKKLREKNLDAVIANDVSKKDRGFSSEKNSVLFIDRRGRTESTPLLPKSEIAARIWDRVEKLSST
jgi:phosphopantothenoylcysteine decarboxylase/phosphopantothenate--cysteine ligase